MSRAPLLELPVGEAVWKVAWPMVLLGWVRAAYIVADTAWIGLLGDDALAAVAAASFAWWILAQVGDLAATGVHAWVSQAEGARDLRAVPRLVVEGTTVAVLAWAAVAVASPWLLPAYLDALGLADGPVRGGAEVFLVACVFGALAFALQGVVGGVFRGLGDTRTALGLTVLGLVVNAGLDPLLIWGFGPVPALGIAGAAWATFVASGVSAAMGVLVLARRGRLSGEAAPSFAGLRQVAGVGLPVALSGVGFSLVYVLLGRMITAYGDAPMAALGVGHRLESFPYLAAVGLQVACATLVGQAVGAGDREAAGNALRVVLRATDVSMVVAAVLGLVLAGPVYGFFATDPAIVASGAVYLRCQAAVWVFMGWECVGEGALTGLARTAPAAWVVAIGTALRLPMAWLFAEVLGLGVTGIWIAVAVSTAGKGVVLRALALSMLPASKR